MNQPGKIPKQIDPYFDELESWLNLEGIAERERMAQRRAVRSSKQAEKSGETLLRMQLVDHRTGLAGRMIIDFKKNHDHDLPPNRLKTGSPVIISNEAIQEDHGIPGVISGKRRDLIQVAVDQWPEGERFRIDLSPDETTRRRQLAAMGKARLATGRSRQLRDMVIGIRDPRYPVGKQAPIRCKSILNESQESAVAFALESKDIAIIHGPPGTGKTTTLAELIYQSVRRGQRVLACAPSNTGVDNLLEKIIPLGLKAVRVGHPARVFPELRDFTLDELVDRDPHTQLIHDMRREVQQLIRDGQRVSRGRDSRRRKRHYFAEAGILRGEIRSLEKRIVKDIIQSAEVICTTSTIDEELIGEQPFELVVIDEACQATMPGTWQAVLKADKLVLAGDHQQLPPTVISKEAANRGLKRSIMEELIDREGTNIFKRLSVQYRMNQKIMQFPSQIFYEGDLIANAKVEGHLLADDNQIDVNPMTLEPLLLVDTAGADFQEEVESEGESKLNPKEADLVMTLITRMLEFGVSEKDIAIIAPYAAQVRHLRNLLGSTEIEVDTVDGFQGREKDLVVLTMVRSNRNREIGFLSDLRRTNVAMTRARKKIIFIGDSATLSVDPFYSKLIDYFENEGAYASVWEYLSN